MANPPDDEIVGVEIILLGADTRVECADPMNHGPRPAEYVIVKPRMVPPLPAPLMVYVCEPCMHEFLRQIGPLGGVYF